MAVPSERPKRPNPDLEAFVDSDFLTLVESDLAHQTDTVLPGVQVSAEDQDFIERVFSQVKDVDFRAPPPPPPPVALDGHEKKIGDMREKVRRLERDLARVAHVWSLKHEQMSTLDDILGKAETARKDALQTCRRVKEQAINVVNAYKQQAQAAQTLSQTLGARKAELELNYQRLCEDHAQMSSRLTEQVAKLEREAARSAEEYRQKLESAQAAFQQLREQSAHHLGMLQAQVQGREEESTRQSQEIARLQILINERDTTLESVRAAAAAAHDALRDGSAAALEAQRSAADAEYASLKQSADQALTDHKAASEAAYDDLKSQSTAKYEALLESSTAKYESLVQSSAATLETQRVAASDTLEAVKTDSRAEYESLKNATAASYEALREQSASTLESTRTTHAAVLEDLSKRLADSEKAEAVARARIEALEDTVRERDQTLAQTVRERDHAMAQSEQRFHDMDRQHQGRITKLEAALEQLRQNGASDRASLLSQLNEAQRDLAVTQARASALEAQAQDKEETLRTVADKLAEREQTTARLVDELGSIRVEQEHRLTEKSEALRAGYDEVARLQGGLAQVQTELAQMKSLYDIAVHERDAFRKLVPPNAV